MHIVKCVYCNKNFDIDSEKYQKINSRRYAHLNCNEQANISTDDIVRYAKQILKEKANVKLICIQIQKFINMGFTYNGIYYTLIYWYEVKKNSADKSMGGIGIVPYIYNEAKKYWADRHKNGENIIVPKKDVVKVTLKYKKRKKIQIGEDGDNG